MNVSYSRTEPNSQHTRHITAIQLSLQSLHRKEKTFPGHFMKFSQEKTFHSQNNTDKSGMQAGRGERIKSSNGNLITVNTLWTNSACPCPCVVCPPRWNIGFRFPRVSECVADAVATVFASILVSLGTVF